LVLLTPGQETNCKSGDKFTVSYLQSISSHLGKSWMDNCWWQREHTIQNTTSLPCPHTLIYPSSTGHCHGKDIELYESSARQSDSQSCIPVYWLQWLG